MRTAEHVRYAVLAAQREGNRWLAAQLDTRADPSQAEVLRVLGDHAPLSLSGLGSLLVCESGTNPSRLVDRLVEVALVSRTIPDGGDRRQVSLELTEEGRALEAQVQQIEQRLYADLDGLGSPEQLATLLEVLERIVAGRPSGTPSQPGSPRHELRYRTATFPHPREDRGAALFVRSTCPRGTRLSSRSAGLGGNAMPEASDHRNPCRMRD